MEIVFVNNILTITVIFLIIDPGNGYAYDTDVAPDCGSSDITCANHKLNVSVDHCQGNCNCPHGFLFDENTNTCVLPEDRTPACKSNEVYSSCINFSDLFGYVKLDQKYCVEGCICKKGYLRDINGICVPKTKSILDFLANIVKIIFSKSQCLDPNEVYDECFSSCSPQTCESIGKKFNCPLEPAAGSPSCNATCKCKDGYFRNKTGNCIPEANCYNSTAIDRLNQGNDAFTGEFLYQLYQLNPGKNFVASPFSVLIPLAILALFANGTTFDQLISVLNLRSKDEIRTAFPSLINMYKDQEQVELILAAKYYADQRFPLSTLFIQQSKEVFDAEGQNINFTNPTQAADIINKWVNQKTNGFIPFLVNPASIDPSSRLIIADVLYFSGNWTKQFNPNNTKDKDFFVANNKTVQVKTMFQQETFKYAFNTNLNAQVLQLFYKGGNVSSVIVLPKDIEGVNETINILRDMPLRDVVNGTSFEKVMVSLPMFDITNVINLLDILKKVNVTLDQPTDDLDAILQKPEKLEVSAAIQKCRIKVDPTGTEAAAANAITVVATAVEFPQPQVIVFDANHPFLFFILMGADPIFCGAFTGHD